MRPHDDIGYHEGLAELQELKCTMMRTAWRYCLVGLSLAVLVALIILFADSPLWADLREFIRHH